MLSAAHVVWNDTTGAPDPAADVTVAFDLPSGRVIVPVTEVVVDPAYNGNAEAGNDLSLLSCSTCPSA